MDLFEKYYYKLEEDTLSEKRTDNDPIANKRGGTEYYNKLLNHAREINSRNYDPALDDLQDSVEQLEDEVDSIKNNTKIIVNTIKQNSHDIERIEDYLTSPKRK